MSDDPVRQYVYTERQRARALEIDANLRAAAPEMLVALKLAREIIFMMAGENAKLTIADLDATIAKAEGK